MPEMRRVVWRLMIVAAATVLHAGIASAAAGSCSTVVLPTNVAAGPPDAFTSLHPILSDGSLAAGNAIPLLYRPMIWIDADARIDFSRSAAARIDVDPTHRRFTVTLRRWHWSDGTPVDAGDVLYAWDMIRRLGHTFTGYGIGGIPNLIQSITAPDAHTVVFSLTRPVNPDWFEQLGIGQFTPLPRQSWSHYSVAEQETLQSQASFYRVVDGPYRLQSFALGRQATFVANDAFDGAPPHFPRYVDTFLQGANPLEALRAGQLDAANLPFALWSAADHLDGFRRIALGPQGGMNTIVLNLRNPGRAFLADVRVRQAIARAIDQRRIIDSVYRGQSQPQMGFVATMHRDMLPPELRDGAGPLSFDPAAARALLDAAGARPGPDGVRVRDGQRLAFQLLITAGAEDGILLAQIAQANLAAVGIAMSIKEVEFNQLYARILGPRTGWDATFFGWGAGGYPDGTQWFATDSESNFSGYSDPTMDRLLDTANSTPGLGPLWALERYVVAQQPMIFLPTGSPVILARKGLEGLDHFSLPGSELEVETLHDPACGVPRA